MILAADRCRERSPNFYVADSLSEIEGILNPRLGDVALMVTEGSFDVWRLTESDATPDGSEVIQSNACEYLWIKASGSLGFVTPQLFGARGNGTTDDTEPVFEAFDSLPASGGEVLMVGVFRMTSKLVLARRQWIVGVGYSTDPSSAQRSRSAILKDHDDEGVEFGSYECGIRYFQVDCVAGRGGDGIYIPYGQATLNGVASTGHGGNGLRVGGKVNGLVADQCYLANFKLIGNSGHGLYVHSANGGLPDANANTFVGGDCRSNLGSGICIEKAFDNVFVGTVSTLNGSPEVWLKSGAKGNKFLSCYIERIGATDVQVDLGANANVFDGFRQGTDPVIVDNGQGNKFVSNMSSRVLDPVDLKTYFKEIRVIGESPFVGQLKLTQSASDEYTLESVPGNLFATLKGRVSGGRMACDFADYVCTFQMNFNGNSAAFDGYIRLNDTRCRMELARLSVDNQWINFDCHFNSSLGFISDFASSNFQIRKNGNSLKFNYAAGVALDGVIVWGTPLEITSGGQIIEALLPTYANNAAATGAGLTPGMKYQVTGTDPRQVAVVF